MMQPCWCRCSDTGDAVLVTTVLAGAICAGGTRPMADGDDACRGDLSAAACSSLYTLPFGDDFDRVWPICNWMPHRVN